MPPETTLPLETVGATATIAIDRVLCTGHGICAHVLPDQVSLDEWGYPILDDTTAELAAARAAARLCPARAIRLRTPG